MGKSSILAVLALLVGATWLQLSVLESQGGEARLHADRQFGTLARDAAHTGYAAAAHQITSDTLSPLLPLTGQTDDGTYSATFSETSGTPREVVVRSEGRAGGEKHIVEALFRDGSDGPPATPAERLRRVPPHLRYAVFSDQALRLSVLPRIRSGTSGINADVHTNGRLSLALSASALLGIEAVEGFGTYAGGLSAIRLLADPTRAFRPTTNPDELESLRERDPVRAQPFDADAVADAHRALGRTVRTESGGLRLLGRVPLGTAESPEVLVVDGDLALVDVQFEGYGVVLIKGGVVVDATVTGLLASLLGQPEGRVVVAAEGPVVFNGAGDVQGHYVTNGSALFAGAPSLHGGIAALGTVDILLAPTVRYVPPDPSLTVGFPGHPRAGLDLVTMREWKDTSDR